MSRLAKFLSAIYLIADFAVIWIISTISLFLFERNHVIFGEPKLQFVLMLVWLVVAYATKLYTTNLHNGLWLRFKRYILCYVIFIPLLVFTKYLLQEKIFYEDDAFVAFLVGFPIANGFANTILITIISKYRSRKENIKSTLIAGVGESAAKISDYLNKNPDFGFKVDGYLRCNGEDCKINKEKIYGTLADLNDYLSSNATQEIIIALPPKPSMKKRYINQIVGEADSYGVRVMMVPDFSGLFGDKFKIVHSGNMDLISIRQLPLDGAFPIMAKGIFDFFFALLVLLVLFIPLVIISILIKFDSKGSIFYCPVRVGRNNKNFRVFKFRTMFENDPTTGGQRSTVKDDPRITKVGKILRKYNLDELPQFINVLLGEMSVVGPRPHRNFLNQQMREHVDKYMLRHYFNPGITGWAQVNGWRGPTETQEQISQRTACDLWYIENWSFMLDLKIIWMTIFSSKARKNAF